MIYLILAIISSALTSIVMRFSEKHVQNNMGMFMANYGVCVLLSRIFMGETRVFVSQAGMPIAVALGLFSGVLYLGNFVILKNNMKQNGVVLATTFMKLGVLVPTLMAIIVFRERPKALQIIGFVIALVAIVMIHFEKEGLTQGQKKGALLILLIISGITDSMANVYDKTGAASLKDHYLFYTFLAAFVIALILAVKQRIGKWDVLFGILIGIPNYFSARFLLAAVGKVPAVIVYPAYSVTAIVIISAVGVLVFREKISRKKAVALGLILISLVLLNV